MIQRHLDRSPKADPPNKAKIFAKLVMEGQIHSALRYLTIVAKTIVGAYYHYRSKL